MKLSKSIESPPENAKDDISEILDEIYSDSFTSMNSQIHDNKHQIVIAGAGVAGIFSALKILSKFPQAYVKIIEQKDKILSGTSANTPGRMGLGYHYKDFETALQYMINTLNFMKKYKDCFIEDEDIPNLVNGRYFILKDSIIDPQVLMATYDRLSLEFEKLWMNDPEIQKLFPETCHLHRTIHPSKYQEFVDPKMVHLAIETREKLLDWNKFVQKVLLELDEYLKKGRAEIITSTEVVGISYDEDSNFRIELQKKTPQGKDTKFIEAGTFINATWQNAECIDKKFYITSYLDWVARMKFLAEIKVPKSMIDAHSMFFCLGPFAMFSNMGVQRDEQGQSLGHSLARITYAEVTNHSYYPSTEMPDLYRRLLENRLTEDDIRLLDESGKKIVEGVARFIPKIAEAELVKVLPGIIKSVGDVNIFDPNSKFHERREDGIEELSSDYIKNASIKLFFCLSNAEKLVDVMQRSIVTKIVINHLLKKISTSSFVNEGQKVYMVDFLRIYLKRYLFDQFNNLSSILIEQVFKEKDLSIEKHQDLSANQKKKLLDEFFEELFSDKNKSKQSTKLSKIDSISSQKNFLKKLYDDLVTSLKHKTRVLDQLKKLCGSLQREISSSRVNAGVNEQSIKELYIKSGYLQQGRELAKDKPTLNGFGNSSFLFDFGDEIKDLNKFKDSFLILTEMFMKNIKTESIEFTEGCDSSKEATQDKILKFYEDFLLKKLPQISFEYEEADNKTVDQYNIKSTKKILDRALCAEVIEWIDNINDKDIKKTFFELLECFLKEFAKTIEKFETDGERKDRVLGHFDTNEGDNKKILQSIRGIVSNLDINIRQFINIVSFKVNLLRTYSLEPKAKLFDDEIDLLKRNFLKFKVDEYEKIFEKKTISEEDYKKIKDYSFDDYIKNDYKEKKQEFENLKIEEKLNLEVSLKIYELVFEKKSLLEMQDFLEYLNPKQSESSGEDMFMLDDIEKPKTNLELLNIKQFIEPILSQYSELDNSTSFGIVLSSIENVKSKFERLNSYISTTGVFFLNNEIIDDGNFSENETLSRTSSSDGIESDTPIGSPSPERFSVLQGLSRSDFKGL